MADGMLANGARLPPLAQAEQSEHAAELNESQIVEGVALVAHREAADSTDVAYHLFMRWLVAMHQT